MKSNKKEEIKKQNKKEVKSTKKTTKKTEQEDTDLAVNVILKSVEVLEKMKKESIEIIEELQNFYEEQQKELISVHNEEVECLEEEINKAKNEKSYVDFLNGILLGMIVSVVIYMVVTIATKGNVF